MKTEFYGDKRGAWGWLPKSDNGNPEFYGTTEIWMNQGLGLEAVVAETYGYFEAMQIINALNRSRMKWYEISEWTKTMGNEKGGDPVFYSKTLWQQKSGGWHVDVHKFVQPDKEGCYHTHPAYAIRIITKGGYEEEVYEEDEGGLSFKTYKQTWKPGNVGLVAPNFCHRVNSILNGVASHSIWIRGPVVAKIMLKGPGWRPEQVNKASAYQSQN